MLSQFDEARIYRMTTMSARPRFSRPPCVPVHNPMFDRLWNHDRVSHVEITVAEDGGSVARRLLRHAGVVRDMVQNHLTQLLTLVAIGAADAFEADQIRDEKVKVIKAVAPINGRRTSSLAEI